MKTKFLVLSYFFFFLILDLSLIVSDPNPKVPNPSFPFLYIIYHSETYFFFFNFSGGVHNTQSSTQSSSPLNLSDCFRTLTHALHCSAHWKQIEMKKTYRSTTIFSLFWRSADQSWPFSLLRHVCLTFQHLGFILFSSKSKKNE